MKNSSKDLLRLEKDYIVGQDATKIGGELDHNFLKIKSLFEDKKPKVEKPNFILPKSSFCIDVCL